MKCSARPESRPLFARVLHRTKHHSGGILACPRQEGACFKVFSLALRTNRCYACLQLKSTHVPSIPCLGVPRLKHSLNLI